MTGVISTNPARCRDCYRCVRACPIKAVRIAGGQAEVVAELCISCATCVRACPQGAKVVRDDLPAVKAALAAGRPVVASVAPSAPAYFDMRSFGQMEDALAGLGFAATGETAFGAEMVGEAHGEWVSEHPDCWPVIASSCPVVVNLVEQYYPDLISHLAPVVSPMIAHGRYLRARYGPDAFVVFIGPCIAKKGEIRETPVADAVDAVLTFAELDAWLLESGLEFPSAPDTDTARTEGGGVPAQLFPVEGGLVRTAGMDTDRLDRSVIAASGIGTCQDVLEGIRSGTLVASLVELMACGGGCINGPALMDRGSIAVSRQRVLAYAAHRQRRQPLPRARGLWPELARTYRDRSIAAPEFTEAEIREALRRVDKHQPEDELNCGSCGYNTCREKAVATLRGMAEATMCIPYMRARAESLNNVVMDVSPNAILIVDGHLRVQDMSPSAADMFNCNRQSTRGKPLRDIIPIVEDFMAVRDSGRPILNKLVSMRKDLVVEETIMPVSGEHVTVSILRDVTGRERQRVELERFRAETLRRSQEVINKQMRVAHEIAGLLGETTAETKVLLTQLARLMEETQNEPTG